MCVYMRAHITHVRTASAVTVQRFFFHFFLEHLHLPPGFPAWPHGGPLVYSDDDGDDLPFIIYLFISIIFPHSLRLFYFFFMQIVIEYNAYLCRNVYAQRSDIVVYRGPPQQYSSNNNIEKTVIISVLCVRPIPCTCLFYPQIVYMSALLRQAVTFYTRPLPPPPSSP